MGKFYIYAISFLLLSLTAAKASLPLKSFDNKQLETKFFENDSSKESKSAEDTSTDDDEIKKQEFSLSNTSPAILAEHSFTLIRYNGKAILLPHLETPKRPPQQASF